MSDKFPSILDTDINKELNKIWLYSVWLGKALKVQADIDIFLSIKKDIIIHLGSIVEGVSYYILEECCSKGIISLDKIETGTKPIHIISDIQRVLLGTDKVIKIKAKSLDFCKVIDLIYDKGLVDDTVKKTLHKIRDSRNGVHVSKKMLHDADFKKLNLAKDFMPDFRNALVGLKTALETVVATPTLTVISTP